MGNAIPSQHPAVVLRSHYTLVRALLAVAMIAVVGLTIAVVILANESNEVSTSAGSTSVAAPVGTTRYDGGPEEGTRAIGAAAAPIASDSAPAARYDSGPEEGSADVSPAQPSGASADGHRYDGGPEEGTRGPLTE
jgi:hypothetical protein